MKFNIANYYPKRNCEIQRITSKLASLKIVFYTQNLHTEKITFLKLLRFYFKKEISYI